MPAAGIASLNFQLLDLVKILFLLAIGVYSIFALVLIKQVSIMTSTLEIGFEVILKIVSYLHFIGAILVFLFALTTL